MSEIKGQILGVVLVLAIFGAIGTVLVNSFKTSATNVTQKMNSADTEIIDANKNPAGKLSNDLLNNNELLTF